MTLIKKSAFPATWNEAWLSDFFDNGYFDSYGLKKMHVVPSVNVIEKESEFEIEMAAPGLTKKDFVITIDNGVLTISSEKEIENETKDKNYTRKEYSYTNFSRSFTLPENVKTEKVDAVYENGILKLMLPKEVATKVKPKAIPVH